MIEKDKTMLCISMIVYEIKESKWGNESGEIDFEQILYYWTKKFEIEEVDIICEIELSVLNEIINFKNIPIVGLLKLHSKTQEKDYVDYILHSSLIEKTKSLKIRSYSLYEAIKNELERRTK